MTVEVTYSGYGRVSGNCEHGGEYSTSEKVEESLGQLRDY
jgi:hypothetical protein